MYYPSYDDYMRDIFYFNGLQQGFNQGYPYMAYQANNLNDYFPSIYKIVNPVVQKVVAGNNYQFANEESVNNIVDVVLGITSGDIASLSENSNSQERRTNQNCNSSNVNSQDPNNNLLRDLIKILTIKELQSKQNVRRFPYTYGSNVPYLNNQFGG